MSRCVIVGGADIADYPYIKKYLKEDDFTIFCDSGLKHMERLGVCPDLIIGDFDSWNDPHMDVETLVLPTVKDDTDTVYAVKEAKKRGFTELLMIGAVGGRIDHSLGNIYVLYDLDEAGIPAMIADDYSEMLVVSDQTEQITDQYPFFSLINMTGKAEGICIKNAKYELENASIQSGYQYGISNEVTKGQTAEVSVRDGKLLLIKVVRDKVDRHASC